MNVQTRVSLIIGLVVVLALTAFFLESSSKDDGDAVQDPPEASSATLVREDSHVLGEKGSSGVEFVEFLDFQCPACAAMHPVVEQLRKDYAGEVTFVLRQFPLPSHPHAVPAALAVEAAAQQDKLVEMYNAVFAGQDTWSTMEPAAATQHFRDLGKRIGLDLSAYDTAVADPATAARVERDVADGEEAGVASTPTLFVDGKKLQPESYDDIVKAIDAALVRAGATKGADA